MCERLGHGQPLPPGWDGAANTLDLPVPAVVLPLREQGVLGSSCHGEAREREAGNLCTASLGAGGPEGRGDVLLGSLQCSSLLSPHHIAPLPQETWVVSQAGQEWP